MTTTDRRTLMIEMHRIVNATPEGEPTYYIETYYIPLA